MSKRHLDIVAITTNLVDQYENGVIDDLERIIEINRVLDIDYHPADTDTDGKRLASERLIGNLIRDKWESELRDLVALGRAARRTNGK
jgi:hypothetical protein